MPTESYDDILTEELRDVEVAAEYLSAAIEGGNVAEFLMALRYVTDAHGGGGHPRRDYRPQSPELVQDVV